MSPDTRYAQNATNDLLRPGNQQASSPHRRFPLDLIDQPTEPQCHFDPDLKLSDCCLNSADPSVAAHHQLVSSRPTLTWSNVGCEFEKAKFHLDEVRGQECLDFLKQPWVLSNLGRKRVSHMAERFNKPSLKEWVALHDLLSRVTKREQKGRTTCQFATRANFKFINYLDRKTATNPSSVGTIHNSSLLKIMKWAQADDELASIGLMEKFLLSDVNEKYFTHHMQLHLADRFNFPTLRMRCLSSLRTVECIEEFQSSPEYSHHLSSIDRQLVEKRVELLRAYREVGQRVPDEFYLFDLHSGCFFEESIQERYNPALLNLADDNDGGEIIGPDFSYY